MTITKSPQEDLCVDHLVVRKYFTHLYDCEQFRNKVSGQAILQRFRLHNYLFQFKPNKSSSHKQDPKICYSSQAKLHWSLRELTTQDGSHWVLEVCSWILEFGDVIVIPKCFDLNHAKSCSTFSLSFPHVGKHAHLSFLRFACPSSLPFNCNVIATYLSPSHTLHTHTPASVHHSSRSQHNVCFYNVSLSHSVFTSVMSWSNNSP